MGYNLNTASETGAVAMGTDCSALGQYSIATGYTPHTGGGASLCGGDGGHSIQASWGPARWRWATDSTARCGVIAVATGARRHIPAPGNNYAVALGWGCIASGQGFLRRW